jgi:hypothetical protein
MPSGGLNTDNNRGNCDIVSNAQWRMQIKVKAICSADAEHLSQQAITRLSDSQQEKLEFILRTAGMKGRKGFHELRQRKAPKSCLFGDDFGVIDHQVHRFSM